MRSALNRLLLACGLAAVAAACLPAASAAAAPQGSLMVAEYDLLLAMQQRSEELQKDRKPTLDEAAAICAGISPLTTRLLSSVHSVCTASVRVAGLGAEDDDGKGGKGAKPCRDDDLRCAAREVRLAENAYRAVVRAAKVLKQVVAARGLTGQCARAINGPPGAIELMETFADRLRDLRRAMMAEDVRAVDRATRRLVRAIERADVPSDDAVALLATCPRV
jgi:hypothetical protein